MSWLTGFFTAVSFFFSSLFGSPTVPVTPTPVTIRVPSNKEAETSSPYMWTPITASSSPGYTLHIKSGSVYGLDPFSPDPVNPQEMLVSSSSATFSLAESRDGKFAFYAKDATQVYAFTYYNGLHINVVEGADSNTFTVLAPLIGIDKNGAWEASNKLPFTLDPATFTILGNSKYKDKNHTYLIGDGITVGYEILDDTTGPSPKPGM